MAKALEFQKLAEELIAKWAGSDPEWATRSREAGVDLSESELAAGLKALADSGMLDIAKLFTGPEAALASGAIALASDAIRSFQKFKGLPKQDGIFGIRTWKAMKRLKGCPPADEGRKKELSENALPTVINAQRNKNIIFYSVDFNTMPETIAGVRTINLITDAWNLWQRSADFKIMHMDPEDANVIINMRSLGDGPGGTLGLAHVGGPRISQQLECSMDADEDWDSDTFRVAICHELGHILGLSHDSVSGQMMSPFLSDEVTEPKANDIARIQALWGVVRDDIPGPVIIDDPRRRGGV